jgi:DNA-binding NarL/FixJ family response regulator
MLCWLPPATASVVGHLYPARLTPREAEILVLLARGMSNREIAHRLSVSARTVSSHVEHVYSKAGVSAPPPCSRWDTDW